MSIGVQCQRLDSDFVFSNVYVVVTFYPSFKFYFPWFWGMVIYSNDFEKKKTTLINKGQN